MISDREYLNISKEKYEYIEYDFRRIEYQSIKKYNRNNKIFTFSPNSKESKVFKSTACR